MAAVSVGVVRGAPLLDLDYEEDAAADVDFNVVMTDKHAFVEIQGTAEKEPFMPATLDELLVLASTGLDQLFAAQRAAISRGDWNAKATALMISSSGTGRPSTTACVRWAIPRCSASTRSTNTFC